MSFFGGKKALWNAVDSLTIDFSTFPNDLKNIYINVLPGTQHRRAALEKIGYIKIIGDTLGRRIYIDFIRAKIGFGAFPRDPILYADSNIDFSNLIYHRHVNPINNCGEKISLTDFSKFFKKESLNKDAGYYIWNYDSNSTIKDKKIGDKITKNDGYLLITGIEYLYD